MENGPELRGTPGNADAAVTSRTEHGSRRNPRAGETSTVAKDRELSEVFGARLGSMGIKGT